MKKTLALALSLLSLALQANIPDSPEIFDWATNLGFEFHVRSDDGSVRSFVPNDNDGPWGGGLLGVQLAAEWRHPQGDPYAYRATIQEAYAGQHEVPIDWYFVAGFDSMMALINALHQGLPLTEIEGVTFMGVHTQPPLTQDFLEQQAAAQQDSQQTQVLSLEPEGERLAPPPPPPLQRHDAFILAPGELFLIRRATDASPASTQSL